MTAWLEEQWDPDLTVAEWWERLGTAGWSAPNLPVDRFGRGLSRSDATAVHRAISDFGALGPPSGLGAGELDPFKSLAKAIVYQQLSTKVRSGMISRSVHFG